MRLKTFRGPDLATALSRARAEMGPQALVLATNEVPGRLGLARVEITVGTDSPLESATEQHLQRLSQELQQMRDSFVGVPSNELKPPQRPDDARLPELDPRLRSAAAALVRTGLSADLADRFARIAGSDLAPRGDAHAVAAATERGVASLIPFLASPLRSRVLFVVGPPGSGKTTTLAKLAARMRLDDRRSVSVGQADTERIGALEQAQIFCRHIGATLTRIDGPDDLRQAVDRLPDDGCLLVDTAGVGRTDDLRLEALLRLRGAMPQADTALLIPAGLHHDEVESVIERFAPVEPTCVALTKVDDGGRRVGDLVTALAPRGLPLAFVTNGHRVPHDLETATPRRLAAMMLRFGREAERRQEIRA